MDAKTRAQLDALQKKPGPWLLATDIAPILRWDPQWLRIKGRKRDLPFPSEPHGNRVQFPKAAFIAWVEQQSEGGM